MATFFRRVVGAVLLNAQAYEDVEADRSATTQAMVVVLLSSLATGIGLTGGQAGSSATLAAFSAQAFALWVVWAVMIVQIGTRILPSSGTRADVGQLLRVTGFASAPGLLRIAGAIPGATVPVFIVTTAWMLMAMIVAVRQALDYTSTTRAFGVCTMGLALAFGCAFVIGMIFSPVLH